MLSSTQRLQANKMDRHTLKLKTLRAYRSWPWEMFRGSAACLKWSFRDLMNLDATMAFVTDRSLAVQAGGNLGLFPKRLAEDFKVVHTFEPDAHLFKCMQFNVNESNVVMRQAALGNSNDGVNVLCRRRDPTGKPEHEGLTHVSGRGKIPQVRIDDMDLKTCGLIYLDIEGYELYALRGAEKTIERCRPVIGVEINKNIAYYGGTKQQVRDWIIGKGYKKVADLHSDEVFVPC